MRLLFLFIAFTAILLGCNSSKQEYDTIIRNGMIYDGNGGEPYKGDIGINADTIAFIGDLSKASAKNEVDAKGNAVAPGFINMMGHSEESFDTRWKRTKRYKARSDNRNIYRIQHGSIECKNEKASRKKAKVILNIMWNGIHLENT